MWISVWLLIHHHQVSFSLFSDSKDVWLRDHHLLRVLAALPCIFHLLLLWPCHHGQMVTNYGFKKYTNGLLRYTPNMYLAFYWLAMANSCVNPIIYYWMNKRYSKYIPLRYFMIEIVLGFEHTSTRSYAVAMQGNLMRRSHKHSPEGKKLFIFIYLYNFGILHFHGILRDLLRSLEISRDPMLTMLTMLKNNFRSIMGREGEERFRCSISCPRESISRVRNQILYLVRYILCFFLFV